MKKIKYLIIVLIVIVVGYYTVALIGLVGFLQRDYGAENVVYSPDRSRRIELKDWSFLRGQGIEIIAYEGRKQKEYPTGFTKSEKQMPVANGDYDVEWNENGSAIVRYRLYDDGETEDKSTWKVCNVTFEGLSYPRYYQAIAVGIGAFVCLTALVTVWIIKKRRKKAADGKDEPNMPTENPAAPPDGDPKFTCRWK